MAFLGEEYSTETLPQGGGSFDPLPPGWYSAVVAGAELKSTKAGTGQYIAIQYSITGPAHEGRVVFGNLNIRNQNPVAEKIGLEQFNALMQAIGVPRVRDTDQLIGGHCQIKLSIKEDKTGQYEPSNEVKKIKAISGSAKPAPVPAASSRPPAFNKPQAAAAPSKPAAAGGPPSWAKKASAPPPAAEPAPTPVAQEAEVVAESEVVVDDGYSDDGIIPPF